jgi:hypothetical protein
MKKLLSLLGVISVVGSSSISVIACAGGGSNGGSSNLNDNQKQMINGAEFMTKLILAGRHENLNYNVNEVLSSYMTPISSLSYMPQIYNYNGQQVDVSTAVNAYKNMLAPNMSTFDRDNYAGFYASYVMGMYSDTFYNGFNKGEDGANFFADSMDTNGNIGVNKKSGNNALGYANGLNADLELAKDKDRRELAWGIQDTGALTNYLLDKGFDGANPGSASGTGNPNGAATDKVGTNGAGYLYYNSTVARGSAKAAVTGSNALLNNKFGDTGISFEDQQANASSSATMGGGTHFTKDSAILHDGDKTVNYDQTGALLAETGANLNASGYAASLIGYLNSITKSQTGAEVLGQLTNLFMPILIDNGSSKSSQGVAQGLITGGLNAFWKYVGTSKAGDPTVFQDGVLDALNALDSSVEWTKYQSVRHQMSPGVTGAGKLASDWFFQSKNGTGDIEIAASFLDQLIASYKKQTDATKKQAFFDYLFAPKTKGDSASGGILIKANSTIIDQMGYDTFKNIIGDDGNGGMNLLSLVARTIRGYGQFGTELTKLSEEYNDKQYKNLTSSEKLEFTRELGWDGSSFKKDSILEHAYASFKDESIAGVTEFHNLLTAFANITSNQMKPVHEQVMKYMIGNSSDTWTDSNVNVTVQDSKQKGGKMSFTLDYNGVGDSTSNADTQTTKLDDELLDNFNPYQTKYEYQKDLLTDDAKNKLDTSRTSGVVLGKEQLGMDDEALKNYDGYGMIQDMKKVHHQYKVTWENVSTDEDMPYWVITSIHSFNADGEEFYNIY